jgi:hypothetical protein
VDELGRLEKDMSLETSITVRLIAAALVVIGMAARVSWLARVR